MINTYHAQHALRITVVSRKAKKKQAIHDERMGYLQVRSTALKLVNTRSYGRQAGR